MRNAARQIARKAWQKSLVNVVLGSFSQLLAAKLGGCEEIDENEKEEASSLLLGFW
jgi:hypothetical protein